MFFRREKPKAFDYSALVSSLQSSGFAVKQAGGKTLVTRNGLGAEIADGGDQVKLIHSGVMIGTEIGLLTDLGFQKVFQTASGKRVAARAVHLEALHKFKEDLTEALGLTSLYNEGLGTTNELHLYDRVVGRDGV